jgi:3-mercaptopyruvate sulfurtransferase SseA
VALSVLVAGAVILNHKQRSVASTAPDDLGVPVITVQPQPTQPVPFPDVPRISLQETQARLNRGEALLIDVRSRELYDQSHASGALSFPEQDIEARLDEPDLARDKMLILYCT